MKKAKLLRKYENLKEQYQDALKVIDELVASQFAATGQKEPNPKKLKAPKFSAKN